MNSREKRMLSLALDNKVDIKRSEVFAKIERLERKQSL